MKTLIATLSIPFALALAGCGADMPQPASAPRAAAVARPVLTESHFDKDASGAIQEPDLQTVLASPIDLAFPARVGVVPLAHAFDPVGAASLGIQSVASQNLAAALRGHKNYAQVSEVSTEVNHPAGIEGLRAIAARYRIRYLVLYSQRIEDATHLNAWAWTYPTILGMFAAPGVTIESRGMVEADMLDVRTGTILFSVSEPIAVSHVAWMTSAAREHAGYQEQEAAKAATRLANKVMAQTNALVAAADAAPSPNARHAMRLVPAPVDQE